MFIICEVCVDWVSVRVFSCVCTFYCVLCRALCEAPGCWRLISFTFPCECLCVSWQNSSPHGNSLGVGALNDFFVFAFPRCVNSVLVSRADNCRSDGRLCCFPVPAAGLHPPSRRPDTDANSSWQTLKHTSNTPMTKFVKLLTALTVRREKKNNKICRRFSFVLFSDNLKHAGRLKVSMCIFEGRGFWGCYFTVSCSRQFDGVGWDVYTVWSSAKVWVFNTKLE